jgi:hypothetical protein
VVLPPIPRDVEPSPAARRPLGAWRLENGKVRIAAEADVRRDVVLVLEPLSPARVEPKPVTVEATRAGELVPRITVAPLGVVVTWKNADVAARVVTLEDGDTLLPPEPAEPGATRQVRFTIAGEYVLLDPEHPFERALVVVTDSPFAARADEGGGFAIEAPEGRYRLKAWCRGVWTDVQQLDVGPRAKEVVVRLPPPAPRASQPGASRPPEKNR